MMGYEDGMFPEDPHPGFIEPQVAERTVAVCGGRKYRDIRRLFAVLDHIHGLRPISRLVHGDADGADLIAACWAVARGVEPVPVPADWNRPCGPSCNPEHARRRTSGRLGYCPQAGTDRNQAILDDYQPDELVAFPGGTGTADMRTRAKATPARITLAADITLDPAAVLF